MPKLFVHAPQGIFSAEARAQVAAALTDLGMECERLADTASIRAGVWVFFTEHAADAVFSGGQIAQTPLIALVVNALEGGLDLPSRTRLIAESTDILRKHAGINSDQFPVYVVIHEVPESTGACTGSRSRLHRCSVPADRMATLRILMDRYDQRS